jgi:hypothetical protein
MEPLSPSSFWHVGGLIFWLSLQDKPLDILPAQSFWRETFILLSLCLVIFEEEYADKEVQEEETTDQDEYYEKDHTLLIEFL